MINDRLLEKVAPKICQSNHKSTLRGRFRRDRGTSRNTLEKCVIIEYRTQRSNWSAGGCHFPGNRRGGVVRRHPHVTLVHIGECTFFLGRFRLLAFNSLSVHRHCHINRSISSTKTSHRIRPVRLRSDLLFLAPPFVGLHGLCIQHRMKQPTEESVYGDRIESSSDFF